MAGVGTVIRASDYNSIQSKIALVLGTGTGTRGYGQALASAQVGVGDKITVSQWSNLRTDLLKARQHQTGVDEGGNLTLPLNSLLVSEALRSAYDTMADTIDANRFTVAANQATTETLITGTRTTAWNGVLTNTVTMTFTSSNHARAFFNSGGYFTITSARTGGNSGNKNNTWSLMLSQTGTVTFGRNFSAVDGTSPGTIYSSVGFHSLTTSNQTIYWKPAPSGVYAENDYYIYARKSADDTQVIITSEFRDDDTGDQTGAGPAQDEDVDGTLTNTIQMYRATGSNVSVAAPSAGQAGF